MITSGVVTLTPVTLKRSLPALPISTVPAASIPVFATSTSALTCTAPPDCTFTPLTLITVAPVVPRNTSPGASTVVLVISPVARSVELLALKIVIPLISPSSASMLGVPTALSEVTEPLRTLSASISTRSARTRRPSISSVAVTSARPASVITSPPTTDPPASTVIVSVALTKLELSTSWLASTSIVPVILLVTPTTLTVSRVPRVFGSVPIAREAATTFTPVTSPEVLSRVTASPASIVPPEISTPASRLASLVTNISRPVILPAVASIAADPLLNGEIRPALTEPPVILLPALNSTRVSPLTSAPLMSRLAVSTAPPFRATAPRSKMLPARDVTVTSPELMEPPVTSRTVVMMVSTMALISLPVVQPELVIVTVPSEVRTLPFTLPELMISTSPPTVATTPLTSTVSNGAPKVPISRLPPARISMPLTSPRVVLSSTSLAASMDPALILRPAIRVTTSAALVAALLAKRSTPSMLPAVAVSCTVPVTGAPGPISPAFTEPPVILLPAVNSTRVRPVTSAPLMSRLAVRTAPAFKAAAPRSKMLPAVDSTPTTPARMMPPDTSRVLVISARNIASISFPVKNPPFVTVTMASDWMSIPTTSNVVPARPTFTLPSD